MNKLDKRVYGVIGISSIMANWNADFSGNPKSLSNGEIFGSDKALKYTMKKKWDEEDKKVLYLKSYIISDNGYLIPRTLKERYEQIFDTELKNEKTGESEKVLKNLFSAIDVKNFGATFAEAGNNIAITGAVQFSQGMNKFEDPVANDQPILSPFRDPKAKEKSKTEEDAKSSTLGTKIVSEEAHYFYSFVVNPLAYNGYEELGVTEGYTEDDFKEFKDAAIKSATGFDTNSKKGAENEFSLFVETDLDLYLPNLAELIKFEKREDDNSKHKIIFKDSGILENRDEIIDIEIYYNDAVLELVDFPASAKLFNIYTGRELGEK
ncbi:type I CRISPR-associated protein Cas7 [Peptoniphilus sp. MSJ-1]|uniref:Type I CRISPR-associated protein Cas7 n=1 Tax=Peptoniphilus ovalis TaxID=2841503 RepID=A0ABS6FE42_9FIRM|nr:type I CRISPR-associated protein Cas7 [Peptoniphilus ovalis]MBU5668429.1 type I CRISPR-associated protein Cas7 [Peptoniphilus ovalis]